MNIADISVVASPTLQSNSRDFSTTRTVRSGASRRSSSAVAAPEKAPPRITTS